MHLFDHAQSFSSTIQTRSRSTPMSGPRPENTPPSGTATSQDRHTERLKPVKQWLNGKWVVVGHQLSTSLANSDVHDPNQNPMALGDWSKSRTCIKGPPLQTDQGLSSTFLYVPNLVPMLTQSNGRIWLGYKATNGNICLTVRHTAADYNTFDLAADTSPAHKMVSDSEPCITTFGNKLYIFTTLLTQISLAFLGLL